MHQKIRHALRHIVQQRITPRTRMPHMPSPQQPQRPLRKIRILHPPQHQIQIQRVQIRLLQKRQHLTRRCILTNILPRRLVRLTQPVDHREHKRLPTRRRPEIPAQMHRIMRKLPRRREVKLKIIRPRMIRLQHHRHTPRHLGLQHRHRPHRNLKQHLQLLPRRRRIRHHHLTPVHHSRQKLPSHKLVHLLPSLLDEPIPLTIEILTHQQLRPLFVRLRRPDLLMKQDPLPCRRQGHRVLLPLHFPSLHLRRKRQIQRRQRQHHLRETPRRFR